MTMQSRLFTRHDADRHPDALHQHGTHTLTAYAMPAETTREDGGCLRECVSCV